MEDKTAEAAEESFMRLTQDDILRRQFNMTFWGFDPKEIQGYLEVKREEMADAFAENALLRGKLQRTEEEIKGFEDMRKQLSFILQEAHETANDYMKQYLSKKRLKSGYILSITMNLQKAY